MPNRDPNEILPREERFVVALVANGGDRKDALGKAGYSNTNINWSEYAWKILQRPRVKKRLAELQARAAEKSTQIAAMSRAAVLQELQDNVKLAKAKGDLPSANRALELIGKSMAMFTDKLISEDLDSSLAGKSPEELEALCKAMVLEFGPTVVGRWLKEARPKAEEDVAARDSEDAFGISEEEAGPLPALPEASGVPPGRSVQ